MNSLVDSIAAILGSYSGTNLSVDVPYIVAGCCLVLGLWFVFKVILLLIHGLMGGK